MEVGCEVNGYKFEKWLGRGSFGEVWKCSKAKNSYAIKIGHDANISTRTELDFADNIKFSCPFLVKYFCHFRDNIRFPGRSFIVMELCSHGNLLNLIEEMKRKVNSGVSIAVNRLMKIYIQLVIALHELHTHGIFHRDMKAENVFISEEDDAKLGDFGLSRVMGTKTMNASTTLGTIEYLSPEILEKKPYNGKSDIWALGVLMYQLCTLKLPFYHTVREMIPSIILKGLYEPFDKFVYSDDVCTVLYSMLTRDPTKRPSTHDLLLKPVVISFAMKLNLVHYYPQELKVFISSDQKGSVNSVSSTSSIRSMIRSNSGGGGGGGWDRGSNCNAALTPGSFLSSTPSHSPSSSSVVASAHNPSTTSQAFLSFTSPTSFGKTSSSDVIEPGIRDYIMETAATNVNSFTVVQFKEEFEVLYGRSPSGGEIAFFMRSQRVMKEKEKEKEKEREAATVAVSAAKRAEVAAEAHGRERKAVEERKRKTIEGGEKMRMDAEERKRERKAVEENERQKKAEEETERERKAADAREKQREAEEERERKAAKAREEQRKAEEERERERKAGEAREKQRKGEEESEKERKTTKLRFSCNKCSRPIPRSAKRYHCLECEDFDLCEGCYAEGRGHNRTHNLRYYFQSEFTTQPQLIGGFVDSDDSDYDIDDNDSGRGGSSRVLTVVLPCANNGDHDDDDDDEDISYGFLSKAVGNSSVVCQDTGYRCNFYGAYNSENGFSSVFLDTPITSSVLRWTVQIEYCSWPSFFWLGAGPLSLIEQFNSKDVLGHIVGTYSFFFGKSAAGVLRSALCGVADSAAISADESPVPDQSFVAIEADPQAQTISFFIHGSRMPHAISSVPFSSPLYFGMSAVGPTSFRSVSLRRRSAPTRSTVACTGHRACTPGLSLRSLVLVSLLS